MVWFEIYKKLEQKTSATSNSASSAYTSYNPNDNLSISNLLDICHSIKKAADWISDLEVKEEEEVDFNSVSKNLSRRHSHIVLRNITCHPRLLISDDAVKALAPKPEFLQFRGASSSMNIIFYNDFVRDFSPVKEEEEEAGDISRDVFVLKLLGMPQELLTPLLNFNTLGDVSGKQKYKKAIKKVIGTGFDHTTLKIFQALRVSRTVPQAHRSCSYAL